MAILQENKLVANQKKCQFGLKQIEYLGHIVYGKGVSTNLAKVAAMEQWPIPRNLKELCGFLELTGYYRKFVQNHSTIAHPLTQQLKKDNFVWFAEAT